MTEPGTVAIDRLVEHTSSVPAIAGRKINLFLRERIAARVLEDSARIDFTGRVVLFIHGGYCPGTLAFDVPYRDYSWMAFLAARGFDVFCMDMTGYGRSARPFMDDPGNLDPAQQHLLVPDLLPEVGEPRYPFALVNSDSETDDIDRIVEYLCALRNVEQVALIGWSGGGIRTGTYASRFPHRVGKLILHASSNYDRANPDHPPAQLPVTGAPMTMQTRTVGIDQRWLGTCADPAMIEPGLADYIWQLNVEHDPVGATWGPGGLRAPTRTYWGWNARSARALVMPVLMMTGEQDRLLDANLDLMEDLGTSQKAFITVEKATHFAVWEHQRHVLHAASLQWLRDGRLESDSAYNRAAPDGSIAPV